MVYLCRHKEDGKLYAVKVLKKADVRRKNQFKYVKAERAIMATVDCPFVVKLTYIYIYIYTYIYILINLLNLLTVYIYIIYICIYS